MKTLRQHVLSLPEDERLDVALMLLDDLSGQGGDYVDQVQAVCAVYGVRPLEARFLLALNARSPNCVPREALYGAIYGAETGPDLKILDVIKCHLLKRTKIEIVTHWGVGFSLPVKLDLSSDAFRSQADVALRRVIEASANRGARLMTIPTRPDFWTSEEEAELLRMRGNGSDWWAIAEELSRSKRACVQRYRLLRSGQKVAA